MKGLFWNMFGLCALALLCAMCTECAPKNDSSAGEEQSADSGTFAKGADVSWLTQLESEGYTFTDSSGVATECMKLLKEECGVNAIRLRVWVDPADGWNNVDDVLVKARRAADLGLRIMIDFHFSDTWADPGHQSIPAAWAGYTLEEAKTAVAEHISDMLGALDRFGIEPEWVQIGNETRTGMMWPLGALSNGSNYAELTNAGYDAVKSIFPDAVVIVHLDGGDNLGLYTTVFDYLKRYGGKYDMIGMSLYPEEGSWKQCVDACVSNIGTLYKKYGKSVMVCEIGMDWNLAEECRDCIALLMKRGGETGRLEGIFYWEPEAPAGYNDGYNKGCFSNGTPTVALSAFLDR